MDYEKKRPDPNGYYSSSPQNFAEIWLFIGKNILSVRMLHVMCVASNPHSVPPPLDAFLNRIPTNKSQLRCDLRHLFPLTKIINIIEL